MIAPRFLEEARRIAVGVVSGGTVKKLEAAGLAVVRRDQLVNLAKEAIAARKVSRKSAPTSIRTRPPVPCLWQEDADGNWETACGGTFVLNDGTPTQNKMEFCCYCGVALKQNRCCEGDFK